MGQKFAAAVTDGAKIAFYDSEDSPVPEGVKAIEITDEQWLLCLATPGYSVVNGELVAPVPLTEDQISARNAAEQWLAYRATAQAELEKSDVTILRCVECGIMVPADWAAYRKALRAIVGAVSGDATLPLPMRPVYPVGS